MRKIATLAETGKMEGNIVSRVRKSVLILAAKYKYKLNNLFFARVVSPIRRFRFQFLEPFCNISPSVLTFPHTLDFGFVIFSFALSSGNSYYLHPIAARSIILHIDLLFNET